MKIYIQTDIEGIAGFCFFENRADQSVENFNHRQRMRRLLTNEVNSAVKAAFDAGADEVIVNDSHGTGYNIIFEDLDPRCRIIHGRNCTGPHWLPMLEGSDAMVLVGIHAMGGTPCAITPHSLWKVNDGAIYMSEASMAAAIAGDMGIPTVFASGDNKIIAEMTEKIPDITSVITKEALSPYQACSLIPATSCQKIYDGVCSAVKNLAAVKPYRVQGPVKLTLFDNAKHIPPFDELTTPVVADSISEAFMKCEKGMPWTKFDLQDVDGFVYP